MSSKLIRLTSTDSQCIFDSQYDDDIVLEPDSEIAVHSCNFQTHNVVQIDEVNNRITYQASPTVVEGSPVVDANSPIHTSALTNGTYSLGNMRLLLEDIESVMNQTSKLSNTSEFGLQYQVNINQLNKVSFQGTRAEPVKFTDEDDVDDAVYNNVIFPATRDDYIVAGADVNPPVRSINDATVYCETPFVKGCGVHRCQIGNMTGAAANGFMIGLTANINALRSKTLVRSDIECSIELQDRVGTYLFKESLEGNLKISGIAPLNVADDANRANNDMVEIAMDQGRVSLNIHTNAAGGTQHTIGAYTYDHKEKKDLYAFVCLYRGPAEVALHSHELNVDPYFGVGVKRPVGGGYVRTALGTSSIPMPSMVGATTYKLQTVNHPTVAAALGFGNRTDLLGLGISGPVQIYNVFSHQLGDQNPNDPDVVHGNRIFSSVTAENYLVELLNFPVQSYDSYDDFGQAGSKRGRASLIETIPTNETTGSAATLGIIQYQPNTQTFIALSNRDKRLFRNIRARIVHADYSPVSVIGMSSLTLLLKNK